MSRAAWTMALAMLLGCGMGKVGGTSAGTGGEGVGGADAGPACALDLCDDHNPCVSVSCGADGGCVRAVTPEGTLCEGNAADPIHGECSGDLDAPACVIVEWTCLREPAGTKCIGGFCDNDMICCSGGCLNSDGKCVSGPQGGQHCPD